VTSQNEDTTLLGASKKDYSSILRWMAFGITEILPALGGWFNPLIGRAPFAPDAIQRSKEDTLFRMQMLDNHLRDRRYLVGGTLTLADLFVVGIVQGAFRFFLDPAWRSEHPGVSGWFERVHSLPIVMDVSGPATLAEAEMPIAPPRWRNEDSA
jgi:elongation factor 1-gamma